MKIVNGIRSIFRAAGTVAERSAKAYRQRRAMTEIASLPPEMRKDAGLGDYRPSTDNFM